MDVVDHPAEAAAAPIAPPADLAHLANATDAELELSQPGAQAAADAAAAAAPKLSLEEELAGMFELAGAGAGAWLPSVAKVLNAEACRRAGDALAPVLRKYNLARFFEGFAWRAELQALMVLVPIGMAIVQAGKADLAQLRAAATAAAASPIGGGHAAPVAPASSPEASSSSSAPMADYRGQLQPIA